jgi:hypothetical protein
VGDVPADAVAALHRPGPVVVSAAGGEHLRAAGIVGAVPADREYPAALVNDLDGG